MCFFPEVLAELAQSGDLTPVGHFSAELGGNDLYRMDLGGSHIAVFHPGVGAPLAALHLEKAIASGVRAVVACGGAGAVAPGLALGHVVVVSAAIRDEGTSYHYLPPGRIIDGDASAIATAVQVLRERSIPHAVGMTWTTDAPFRETKERVRRRREEGCLTVEMESAALLAIARFRDIRFTQYLYAGDDVSGDRWAHRNWTRHRVRRELFDLATAAALRL
jgi:uridine phosphorylase